MVSQAQDYLFAASDDPIIIDGNVMPKRAGAAQKVLRGEDILFLQESLYERFYAMPYGHLYNYHPTQWTSFGAYQDWITVYQPQFFSQRMDKNIIAQRLKEICDGIQVIGPQCCSQIPVPPASGLWFHESTLPSGGSFLPIATQTQVAQADLKSNAAKFSTGKPLVLQDILDIFDDFKTLCYPQIMEYGLPSDRVHASGWLGIETETTQWVQTGSPTLVYNNLLNSYIQKDGRGSITRSDSARAQYGSYRVETSKALGRWMPQKSALVKADVIGTPHMYADITFTAFRDNFPNPVWCPSGYGYETWQAVVPVQCQKGTGTNDGWLLTSAQELNLAALAVMAAKGERLLSESDIPDNASWYIDAAVNRLGCAIELTDHTKWW